MGGGFATSGGGSLGAGPVRDYSSSYGGIPSVPNPGATAGGAIGGNLGNLGGIYNLANSLNSFNTSQVHNNLATNLPGYDNMVAASSGNIQSELGGNIPHDVINQIMQRAAERGIMTGTTGSENNNAAYLRALGLTSLDMMNLGEKNLTTAIGRTPQAPIFNTNSMLVTPEMMQEAQMAANTFGAAPNPAMQANASLGAAQMGINAGAGAVHAPSPVGLPTNWNQLPTTTYSPYGNDGSFVGRAFPENIVDNSNDFTNWQQWYQSLPTAPTTSNYYDDQDNTPPGYGGPDDYYG